MEREIEDAGMTLAEIDREGGLPVRKFPPLVVFVDEAHEIRRPVQDELLTLLEPSDRRATGSTFVGDATDVTFVIATTEWGDLLGTLQSRLQRVPLEPYSLEEVAEMVQNRHIDWSEEICRRLAVAGRRIPRVALQKAQEFANALEAYGDEAPDRRLDEYFALWGLDEQGVDESDRRYLRVLDESAGPVGLDRIATRLSMGEKEVSRNIEPYLQALGYVEVSVQGPCIDRKRKELFPRSGSRRLAARRLRYAEFRVVLGFAACSLPVLGQMSFRRQAPHPGSRAVQTARPCARRFTCSEYRSSSGMFPCNSSSFAGTSRPPSAHPRRVATRQTCVSIGRTGRLKEYISTHRAVLRPTPGRETR